MPGSIPNPVLYFPAKVVCYALAGWALNKYYQKSVNPLLFGIARVLMGFVMGLLLIFPTGVMASGSGRSQDYLWLGLTRLFVWAGIIWFFYERGQFSAFRFIIAVAAGVLFSFGLDAIYAWASDEFPDWLVIGMC